MTETSALIAPETIQRFREDGAVVLRGALSARELAIIEAAFAHRLEHVSANVLDQSGARAQVFDSLV